MPFDTGAFLNAKQAGANALASGILTAGNAFADTALHQRAMDEKETERLRSEATQTKALRSYLSEIDPQSKDRYTSMGLGELEGTAKAVAIKQHLAEQQREQDLAKQFILQPGEQGPMPSLNPQRVLEGYARAGVAVPPSLIAAMMKQDDGVNWQDMMPREGSTSSGLKYLYGKSGQFQFDPSQYMANAPDVEGYTTVPGKTGPRFVRDVQPKTLPDSYNVRLNTLQDEATSAEANAQRSDEELKALKLPGRTHYQARAKAARQALADHVSRFEEQGYGSSEFWKAEKQRLGLAPAARASAPAGASKQLTATNPKTGEKLIYQDGQWKPLTK